MAISGVSSFSTLPSVGSTSGASSTQLPTDPKANKEAVKKMQIQQLLDKTTELTEKVKQKAEKALKGDTSCDTL
jgi:hypothetical protein